MTEKLALLNSQSSQQKQKFLVVKGVKFCVAKGAEIKVVEDAEVLNL
jgi:hypothetical protein